MISLLLNYIDVLVCDPVIGDNGKLVSNMVIV